MRFVVAALAALTLAGSADAATGTLRGAVRRGPIQPVCRVGHPCTAPAVHVTVLFHRAGRTVPVRTDAAGRYRTVLAAGRWSLSLPHPGIGSIAPTAVRVVSGRTRVVDIAIDTGIR